MSEHVIGAHNGLHSEQGALRGEHPGARPTRSSRSKTSAGSSSKNRSCPGRGVRRGVRFHHRAAHPGRAAPGGTDPGAPCVLIRRGPRSRFVGPAFVAAEQSDLLRLADATGGTVRPLPETLGGVAVELVDPSGLALRVVSGTHQLEALPAQQTARVQLRPRGGAGQHHPAAAAGTHPGAAARARGRADPQVPRSAELVFGSPGDDRQRLLFLPRPA